MIQKESRLKVIDNSLDVLRNFYIDYLNLGFVELSIKFPLRKISHWEISSYIYTHLYQSFNPDFAVNLS